MSSPLPKILVQAALLGFRLFFVNTIATGQVQAKDFGLSAGLAAVEEGDDRQRPAMALGIQYSDKVAARIYYYGRKSLGLHEQTLLATGAYRYPIFGSNLIKMNLGMAIINEQLVISGLNSRKDNFNVGALVGLVLTPSPNSNLFLEAGWDGHIFLAGYAGLFLATGRKQTFTLSMGYGV